MPVRFLLGPARSGKTSYCLRQLRSLERSGRPGIYLVPEQFTYSADRELLDDPEIRGLRHVRVLSFSRLGWWLRDAAAAPAPPAISEEVRPMLLRAVLARMPEERLGPLAPLRARQGFLEELSRFVGEVRAHGALSFLDAVREGLGASGPAPPAARRKIEALAAVFEEYTRTLRDLGRVDPEESLLGVEPLIAGLSGLLSGFTFMVDGFLSWTRREREVAVALARTGASIEIALCCDRPGTASRIQFEPVHRSLKVLSDAFARAEVPLSAPVVLGEETAASGDPRLSALERNLFGVEAAAERLGFESTRAPGVLALQPARDRRQEVLLWARQIDRWTRLDPDPVRPGEIAILLRGLEPYRDLVRETFARWDVPVFLDEKRSPLAHPRVRLLLEAFDVILSNWRRDAVITFLRNPILGAPPATVDLLENLSLEFGWDFEHWFAPVWEEYALPQRVRPARVREDADDTDASDPDCADEGEEEDDAPVEDAAAGPVAGESRHVPSLSGRAALVDPVRKKYLFPIRELQFSWPSGGWTGPDAVRAVRAFEEKMTRWTGPEPDHDPDPEWSARVVAVLGRLLSEAGLLWGDVPVSLDEFARTLRQGCASAKVGMPPLRLDQVVVGDVQRTRLHGIRRLIVGGLNEGVFPPAVRDDPILNEQDRKILAHAGSPLGPTASERQEEEVYLFYIAATRAAEQVVLTWAAADSGGTALAPSLFLEEVKRAAPGAEPDRVPPDADLLPLELLQTPAEAGERLVAHLAGLVHPEPAGPDRLAGDRPDQTRPDQDHPEEAGSPGAAAVLDGLYNLSCLPDDGSPADHVRTRLAQGLPSLLYKTEERVPADLLPRAFQGTEFTSSVSALQQFASCPYQSFARMQLRLVPRPRAQVSPLETGILAHAALDRFFRDPPPASFAEIDHRLAQVFDELEGRPEFVGFAKDEASRYRWGSTRLQLARFLHLESIRLGGSGYAPAARETAFGPKYGNPLTIPLATGERLLLVGRIDRLDRCETAEGPRGIVFDYKRTGKQGLPAALERGLDLQLAAYLLYVRDVLGWTPAGGFYVPVLPAPKRTEDRGDDPNPLKIKMHGIFLGEERAAVDAGSDILPGARSPQALAGSQEMDRLLETARAHLAGYAATLRSGWMAPVPLEKKPGDIPCNHCDYGPVCRFHPGQGPVRREPGEGMITGIAPAEGAGCGGGVRC